MSSSPANPSRSDAASSSLMTNQRREQIAVHVHRQGMARVAELAMLFGVSQVTIRSDLITLERENRLMRDRGGAVAQKGGGFVNTLARVDERSALHLESKKRIARAAAGRISPNDTIILDAGTTLVELGRLLKTVTPLTVVTNSLNIALEFSGASPDLRLILLGGTYNRESGSTLGALTIENLQELIVQKLFIGVQALDLQHGLSDSTMEIAQVKRAMINCAREVILLTDSSKWGRAGFSKVAPLAEIDTMITDSDLPAAAREAVEQAGVELIIV